MRKLATAAAVSLALASGGAFGLGLGDIEMRSSLNQPMQAEIRLTAVKSGELDGMIVQLASADAFARAGIERSTVLTDLKFRVDSSGSVPVIRISSQRPVVEPFLNFLLEVDWPQGRMIREYTVLLDPPVFMTSTPANRNTAGDQATIVQRGDEALVVPTPIERDSIGDGEVIALDVLNFSDDELLELETIEGGQEFDGQAFEIDNSDSPSDGEVVSLTDLAAPNTMAIEQRDQNLADGFEVDLFALDEETNNTNGAFQSEGDGSTIVSLNDLNSASNSGTSGDSVTVNQGDTLYEIARSNAVGGASIQQMMLALLKANDSSFINSNINLVKAGSTLKIPDASAATRLSQAEALAAVSDQNQLWRDYRDQLRSGSGTSMASNENSNFNSSSTPTQSLEEVELIGQDGTNDAGISDSAREIMETARAAIEDREELKLVADSTSTSTAASATADATSMSETERRGEINRNLQLTQEDLTSIRLQSGDLEDQASELVRTTENLDSLVELQQNGVANLEARLAEAKRNGADSVADINSLVDSTGDSSVDLLADASDTTGDIVDSGANALTEAGENLAEVELFTQGDDQTALQAGSLQDFQTQDPAVPVAPVPWYQSILNEPMKLLIAGGALLGVAGLAGLLFWRRRRADGLDEDVEFGDDVEFIDEDEAADLQTDLSQDRFDEFDDFGEVGTATVAVADSHEYEDSLDGVETLASTEFDGAANADVQDIEFGNELAGVTTAMSNEGVDPDDTISEVDVYLNYGLHGQAEELLNKAVESQPNNPDYARKLLETYHGQRSSDKYLYAAKNFHARFGGESNPDWNEIAVNGADLIPDEPLFQNAVSQVETQNSGFNNESAKLSNDDFLPADDSVSGSINRSIDATNNDELSTGFNEGNDSDGLTAPIVAGSAAVAGAFAALSSNDDADSVDFEGGEEDILNQTLDPAFSFDEADLDATNDFSQISDELAAEAGDNLDFPSFDDTIAVPSGAENFLDSTISDSSDLSDALTMDEIDGVIGSADDLTLDLDQLSGDLELDSAELMNPDLSDIELPEMTLGDDFGAGDVAARAASNDSGAMETMLDLAKAYIDMGDKDSASSALDEIVKSGNPAQVTEAETLLRKIS